MAILELRRFNFFDLNLDCDNGIVKTLLKDAQLHLATSGHGSFVLCDSEGNIHILDRNFKATTFRAYALNIALAEYVKHSSFLITVGGDEAGVNPLLKVWNTDKIDKNGFPKCVRSTRLNVFQKTVQPTCLSVQEGNNLLAIGFEDGSILLFRGDITRDRSSKPKVLKDSGSHKVTGVAFRTSNKYSFLFVSSVNHIFFYDVSAKDKEIKIELDMTGCNPGCSIMVESPHGANFVVGKIDAVYCYTTDGKGPCYAVDGEKVLIQWSKTYLVIVSKEEPKTSSNLKPSYNTVSESSSSSENHTITIIDIQNKLIVFSMVMKPILSILVEWGSFYIVTKDQKIHHLAEKNVQSKLPLLFKKNLYDVAIRMAKSQHYDEEGLADIFRQYGDHLYAKGDRFGAIEQYIKTIGKLEPSYIIRKFMESTHMEQLMKYLQALHRAGLANGDHTTLLLNCYTKLGRTSDLKNFIMTKDRELDFDIDIALKVVRGVNPEDALHLAKAHGKHLWVLRILLEDQKKYREAISYLRTLDISEVDDCVLDFGDILINNAPEDTTNFLKEFCVNVKNQEGSIPLRPSKNQRKAHPQDYLHLFLNKSEHLVSFLEHLIQNQTGWSTQIYNALVEHYLQVHKMQTFHPTIMFGTSRYLCEIKLTRIVHNLQGYNIYCPGDSNPCQTMSLVVWSRASEGYRFQVEQRIKKLLQNPDALFDKNQTFILCQTYNFSPGIILLYEENKMYHQVLQYHISQGNYKDVLATCKRYGNQDPYLWIQALWSVSREPEAPPYLLPDILAVIEKEKLLSPLLTVEAMQDSPATLGQARKYLMAILQAEEDLVAQETALIEKYRSETEKIKAHIHDIQTNATIFQGSRCSICQHQLELPSIHFLCQHSYHQHCFQSYTENDNECIVCHRNNKQLLDMIKSQEQNHELHEAFHSQLERSDDGFSIVADYFGRGVFDTLPVVRADADLQPPKPSVKTDYPKQEPVPKKRDVPGTTNVYPTVSNPSSTIEANFQAVDNKSIAKTASELPAAAAAATTIDPACTNPFEEEYDESKNPFADDDDPYNPFSAGDDEDDAFDYDKHLNPFA